MLRTLVVAYTLSCPALALAAGFEGVIEARISSDVPQAGPARPSHLADAGGSARTYVSRLGTRMELQLGGVSMTTVVRKDRPGLALLLDDAHKTYSELDTQRVSGDRPVEKYVARKLGSERVAGHDCVHGTVTGEHGHQWEVWTTRDLGGAEGFWQGQAARGGGGQGPSFASLASALKEAGLDGWPLKMVTRSGRGATTWEATRIERKALPASLFSVEGYRQTEGGLMGAASQVRLSPEQQARVDQARAKMIEAMKSMTPEQRQRMEQVLRAGAVAPNDSKAP